jgi:hypothetical protein
VDSGCEHLARKETLTGGAGFWLVLLVGVLLCVFDVQFLFFFFWFFVL